MIVNYWLLPFAILLLWFPRQWLRSGLRTRRKGRRKPLSDSLRDPGDVSVQWNVEVLKLRNWVDFLRASAGSVAIVDVCFRLDPASPSDEADMTVLIAKLVILGIAIVVQTLRFEGSLKLFAPLFFAMGLSFGLLGWQPALFTCITMGAINLVLPSPALFLTAFAGLEVCFGMFFGLGARASVIAAAITLAPVLVSIVTKRRLAQFSKKTKVVAT